MDCTEVFRSLLAGRKQCYAGSILLMSECSPNGVICDPIFGFREIKAVEVVSIFNSNARPVYVRTYEDEKCQELVGDLILKEGDDLRQDMAVMYMLQLL